MNRSAVDKSSTDSAAPVRVLVVEDSAVDRCMLIALLESDPHLKLVGWAASGAEAIQAAARLAPDIITMDLRMPLMDGLEATRRILQETPTPIVLVTSAATGADPGLTRAAFQAGVLAVVDKPRLGAPNDQTAEEFLRIIKSMAEIKIVGPWPTKPLAPSVTHSGGGVDRQPTRRFEIVAIGASTGGPQALKEILTGLPAGFELPILIVQHMAAGFAANLVDWLTPLCALPVQIATPGLKLDRPRVYIAPSDQHLVVAEHRLALTTDPPVASHRPAANVLFQSVASEYRSGAIGVLLTGMGDDGAIGMRDLKQAGGVTFAQDEASSIVFGMPAIAIGLGVVDYVLAPGQIAALLGQLGRRGRGE